MTRYTEAKPTIVPVTIAGQWLVLTDNDKVSVTVNGANTELRFTSYFGIPQQVTLQKQL